MDLERDSLIALTDGLKENQSLTHLDLSYNNLKDSISDVFGRLLSQQAQNRDHVKWKRELRLMNVGSNSVSKNVPGLKELVLTHNKLGPYFLRSMMKALKEDNNLRVLDLRKNKFTSNVLTDTHDYNFIKTMQLNEAITNVDLRENEGYTRQMKFQLSLVMIRNIDLLRAQGVMVRGTWFNRHVLMLNETIHST